jgi:hypothetical protein
MHIILKDCVEVNRNSSVLAPFYFKPSRCVNFLELGTNQSTTRFSSFMVNRLSSLSEHRVFFFTYAVEVEIE